MNRDEVDALRALLAPTGWPERARVFARALRTSTRARGGLLLIGTPAVQIARAKPPVFAVSRKDDDVVVAHGVAARVSDRA